MKEFKISPSYLLEEELNEFLINLKVKIQGYQDDPSEFTELLKILNKFNKDIYDDVLSNIDIDVIRDIKIEQVLKND